MKKPWIQVPIRGAPFQCQVMKGLKVHTITLGNGPLWVFKQGSNIDLVVCEGDRGYNELDAKETDGCHLVPSSQFQKR